MNDVDLHQIVEALRLYVDALENATQVLKHALDDAVKPVPCGLSELVFEGLKWEKTQGSQIGAFETAYRNGNEPDRFSHAFTILKANNATIDNHFTGDGYAYFYWLYLAKYTDRIYRKKRT